MIKRTHTCGELTLDNLGQEVSLNGWISKSRDLGGLIFIDLRDRYGVTQIVFNESNNKNWENEIPAKNNIAITKAPITKVDPRSGWDKINNPKIAKTNKGLKKPNEVLISLSLLTQ